MGCCIGFWLAFSIASFMLCPLTSIGVSCVQSSGFVISCALNLSLDVVIVALPLLPVWKLQMATTRKVAITGIFGMGLL